MGQGVLAVVIFTSPLPTQGNKERINVHKVSAPRAILTSHIQMLNRALTLHIKEGPMNTLKGAFSAGR